MNKILNDAEKARREKFLGILTTKKVDEKRVERMIKPFLRTENFLPDGEFVVREIYWDDTSDNASFHHWRMKFEGLPDDKNCSVSALTGQGAKDNIEAISHPSGGYVIKVATINRDLLGFSQIDLCAKLEGKKMMKLSEDEYIVREFITQRVDGLDVTKIKTFPTPVEAVDNSKTLRKLYKIKVLE